MKYLSCATICSVLTLTTVPVHSTAIGKNEVITCPVKTVITNIQAATEKDKWFMEGKSTSSQNNDYYFKGYLPFIEGVKPQIGANATAKTNPYMGTFLITCTYPLANPEYKDVSLVLNASLPAKEYSKCEKVGTSIVCKHRVGG